MKFKTQMNLINLYRGSHWYCPGCHAVYVIVNPLKDGPGKVNWLRVKITRHLQKHGINADDYFEEKTLIIHTIPERPLWQKRTKKRGDKLWQEKLG